MILILTAALHIYTGVYVLKAAVKNRTLHHVHSEATQKQECHNTLVKEIFCCVNLCSAHTAGFNDHPWPVNVTSLNPTIVAQHKSEIL